MSWQMLPSFVSVKTWQELPNCSLAEPWPCWPRFVSVNSWPTWPSFVLENCRSAKTGRLLMRKLADGDAKSGRFTGENSSVSFAVWVKLVAEFDKLVCRIASPLWRSFVPVNALKASSGMGAGTLRPFSPFPNPLVSALSSPCEPPPAEGFSSEASTWAWRRCVNCARLTRMKTLRFG